MIGRRIASMGIGVLLLASVAHAGADDRVTGTFTVNGKTTKFSEVYATIESDPATPSTHYLMLVLSDLPVPPADRTPSGLLRLAMAGRIHALRIRWTDATDTLAVVPYHNGIADSGRAFQQMAVIDITKYDESNVDLEFYSKALGLPWGFKAKIKTDVAKGGVADLEPFAGAKPAASDTGAAPGSAGAGAGAPVARRQLGAMGYEFKPDAFFQAIGDRNPAAVDLFLTAGMSPNVKNDQNRHALNHAVLLCGADAAKASAIVIALVKAKGDLKSKDPDNNTTPLLGAMQSCTVEAIDVLLKAGSDLTAKSAGGATALQLAEAFGRAEVAAILRKAGAK